MESKQCTKCGEVKSLSAFRYRKKRRGCDYYYISICKECERSSNREFHYKNKERLNKECRERNKKAYWDNPELGRSKKRKDYINNGKKYNARQTALKFERNAEKILHNLLFKVCRSCGIEKKRDEFYQSRHTSGAIQISACKECEKKHRASEEEKKRIAKWRDANKDKILKRMRAYNNGPYKERKRIKDKLHMVRSREQLTDSYVKGLWTAHGSSLKRSDIPKEFVEFKRLEIKLERRATKQ